jgi:hypothetical protein
LTACILSAPAGCSGGCGHTPDRCSALAEAYRRGPLNIITTHKQHITIQSTKYRMIN